MTAKLVWLPKALTDVHDIYVQIGLYNPAAAERFFDRFEQKAQLLAGQPRMGVRRPEISATTRMLVEAPFVILYETIPDDDEAPVETVQIVRVIDGRRDLENLPI
ncbi:type II toxin-antitoxin system RelE/ParE family toxin [Rhizobium sp. SIMBA_035]